MEKVRPLGREAGLGHAGRLHGCNRYDSREGGGRVAPGAATESRVWNGDRGRVPTVGALGDAGMPTRM